MAAKPPSEPSSSGRKSNLVGVRLSESDIRWLDAESLKREKAGATPQEASSVNLVREMVKEWITVFHLPVDFVETIQADMKEQGVTLTQFIQKVLSNYVVQKRLDAQGKDKKK